MRHEDMNQFEMLCYWCFSHNCHEPNNSMSSDSENQDLRNASNHSSVTDIEARQLLDLKIKYRPIINSNSFCENLLNNRHKTVTRDQRLHLLHEETPEIEIVYQSSAKVTEKDSSSFFCVLDNIGDPNDSPIETVYRGITFPGTPPRLSKKKLRRPGEDGMFNNCDLLSSPASVIGTLIGGCNSWRCCVDETTSSDQFVYSIPNGTIVSIRDTGDLCYVEDFCPFTNLYTVSVEKPGRNEGSVFGDYIINEEKKHDGFHDRHNNAYRSLTIAPYHLTQHAIGHIQDSKYPEYHGMKGITQKHHDDDSSYDVFIPGVNRVIRVPRKHFLFQKDTVAQVYDDTMELSGTPAMHGTWGVIRSFNVEDGTYMFELSPNKVVSIDAGKIRV